MSLLLVHGSVESKKPRRSLQATLQKNEHVMQWKRVHYKKRKNKSDDILRSS